jgi:hypothetical protein
VDSGAPKVSGSLFSGCAVGIEVLGGEGTVSECVFEAFEETGAIVSGTATMPVFNRCAFRAGDAAGAAHLRATAGSSSELFAGLLAHARQLLPEDEVESLLPTTASIGILIEERAAPHIDDCAFSNCGFNVWAADGCGILEGNAFAPSEYDSVLIVGTESDIVVVGNDFNGTARGTGVGVYGGARATIKKNLFDGTKLAAVTLRSCIGTDVLENEFRDCQDAVLVLGKSSGSAKRNITKLRVVVNSQSAATFASDTN